jgi:hypothetical protein
MVARYGRNGEKWERKQGEEQIEKHRKGVDREEGVVILSVAKVPEKWTLLRARPARRGNSRRRRLRQRMV